MRMVIGGAPGVAGAREMVTPAAMKAKGRSLGAYKYRDMVTPAAMKAGNHVGRWQRM